ncbi:class I SAM-dependent methyltransferase [Andreprevotia chitinilytica]|uniref:class I SAM-dependent methyltransferase n=1 Tax=Andreprevotia chitinilytica TaxID=396808 RepID=UPI00054EEA4D|nr:class I SAM-dependent methyltransferase [Andreprevotia chitinilytica]
MSDHDQHVTAQFNPVAAAYLTSVVHAQGEDLQRLAAIAAHFPTARALDLGCGAGHVSFVVAPHVAHVTAYDLSAPMLDVVASSAAERGLRNIDIQQGAAEQMPFPDATFDLVCTRYSAHHWMDVPAALKEIRRVLKPDGVLVVMDIVGSPDPLFDTHLQTIELLRDTSHVRNYALPAWRQMLVSAGFEVGNVDTWKLRLEFASWISRMRTPPERVAAIQSLLAGTSAEVKDYLQLEADYSFSPDTAMIEARPSHR